MAGMLLDWMYVAGGLQEGSEPVGKVRPCPSSYIGSVAWIASPPSIGRTFCSVGGGGGGMVVYTACSAAGGSRGRLVGWPTYLVGIQGKVQGTVSGHRRAAAGEDSAI